MSTATIAWFFEELTANLIVLLPYFLVGFLIESWALADEKNTGKNLLLNVSHGILYRMLSVAIGAAFVTKIESIGRHIPFAGFINLGISDHGKFWLALPLTLVGLAIHDFFYYWYHRLQHNSRWLWAEHELHHSDEHVNITTGVRHHHLEMIISPLFILFPMAILFQLPRVTVLMAVVLRDALDYFSHANVRIGFGPLNRLISNPQVHRIHHSTLPQHIDKNFAARFPIWDVIFGTYYHPKKGEYPPTGLASGRTVNSLWEAAAMPFVTWAKMLTESLPQYSVKTKSE